MAKSKTAKKIAKDNEKFDAASDAEKRVLIAKDALAWLEADALVAECGVYICPVDGSIYAKFSIYPRDTQLRDVNLGRCRVCAVGALLVAKAVRFDNINIGDYDGADVRQLLWDYFSEEQLSLIEGAFERGLFSGGGPMRWDENREARLAAITFGSQFKNDSDRLKAILTNIISNNGTFIP